MQRERKIYLYWLYRCLTQDNEYRCVVAEAQMYIKIKALVKSDI